MMIHCVPLVDPCLTDERLFQKDHLLKKKIVQAKPAQKDMDENYGRENAVPVLATAGTDLLTAIPFTSKKEHFRGRETQGGQKRCRDEWLRGSSPAQD